MLPFEQFLYPPDFSEPAHLAPGAAHPRHDGLAAPGIRLLGRKDGAAGLSPVLTIRASRGEG